MLYDSDSSVQDEEEEEDSNELLGNQPSTSQIPEDIFTIQMPNGNQESSPQEVISNNNRYSQLGRGDEDDYDDYDGHDSSVNHRSSTFITSLSMGNLHKARSFLSRQTLWKTSKSDTQFHYVRKHSRTDQNSTRVNIPNGGNPDGEEVMDSDDEVTLTSKNQGQGQEHKRWRWSYDPGGSTALSAWSTYSELLFEHNGVSWACCVALFIKICMSEQCHAYTKFLKMVAWFTILILVLMCFRPHFYQTTLHASRSHAEPQEVPGVRHFEAHSLMEAIHQQVPRNSWS